MLRSAVFLIALAAAALIPGRGLGQPSPLPTLPPFTLPGDKVQKAVDGAVTLMAFSVVPDLASSVLAVQGGGGTGNAGISMSQFGGGFTLGKPIAPYVEGNIGYSRYDPKFIASNGVESRQIPAKWTTIAGTGGIGVDIPLHRDLTLRPIFDFSLGHVESDSSAAGRLIEHLTDRKLNFLDHGRLNVYGLGGSLALDYWRFREFYDFELLLRYTDIYLQSFDSASGASGEANAGTVSLYSRLRAPTGLIVMRRPLRWVTEFSTSNYVGDQRGVLGFNYLSSVGTGLEFDISALHSVFSRVRFVGRYFFGEHVSGFSGGLALS